MLRLFALALMVSFLSMTRAAPSKSASKAGQESRPKAAPAYRLDTALIHKTYIDGDFDQSTELLEDALNYGGPFSHEDSIFIFKHLGVMYAAKYETREKGKHFLLQLLYVEPTAKIMDMYASDMIYMIFKNIKDEFESTQPGFGKDSNKPLPPEPQPDAGKPRGYAWIGWTAGAVAAAGGIALTIHLLDEEQPVKKVNITRE